MPTYLQPHLIPHAGFDLNLHSSNGQHAQNGQNGQSETYADYISRLAAPVAPTTAPDKAFWDANQHQAIRLVSQQTVNHPQ